MSLSINNYQSILKSLKEKISQARLRASMSVNAQLLSSYWEIGKTIHEQENTEGWGGKTVENLSKDLKAEFPDMQGLSTRNLRYMRNFALAYPHFPFLQATLAKSLNIDNQQIEILQGELAKLTWYHHITLLDKVKDQVTRQFYIHQTITNGWSRDIMVHQIEAGLHQRQGNISSNFKNTIASEHSELVQQIFKDPYKFEFIFLGKEAKERDLENALTNQITKFLLELGQWFAFMGRQYKLTLGDNEYFLDLLFYHTRLRRYIVIDLKIDEFKPEYKGKMEFYLNLADNHLRQSGDEPSIGLILCKTKDGLVAEYALRDSQKPIGIAEYKINEKLPEEIRGELPSIEELEAELEKEPGQPEKPLDKKLNRLKELLGSLKTEEVKEIQNKENTLKIWQNVIIPLKQKILTNQKLKEILDQFDRKEINYWTNHRLFANEQEALEEIEKAGICHEFKINLRLESFKKAGTKAFSEYEDIVIRMERPRYVCYFSNNQQNVLWEKMYHQLPTEEELNDIVEKFGEVLADRIIERLERIGLSN